MSNYTLIEIKFQFQLEEFNVLMRAETRVLTSIASQPRLSTLPYGRVFASLTNSSAILLFWLDALIRHEIGLKVSGREPQRKATSVVRQPYLQFEIV